MRFSLGSRTGRTLLHQSSYPESPAAVQVIRHTAGDTVALDRGADCVVSGVVEEVRGAGGAEDSGTRGSREDSLLGGCDVGGLVGGEDGATRAGGHGRCEPEGVGAPLDVETQGDGEAGDVDVPGAVGGDTVTGGEGLAGGCVLWSLLPVSPRCRATQSW
jgi:hypothetical protein